MNTTVKQIIWGASALLLVGAGFRLFDHTARESSEALAAGVTAALQAQRLNQAEQDLARMAEQRFLAASQTRKHQRTVEALRGQLDEQKALQLLEQTGQHLARLRADAAIGAYADVRLQLKQMDTALADAPEAARSVFTQSAATFTSWMDALEAQRNRIQEQLHTEDYWTQPGFDPGLDRLRLRELAELVDRYARAPASRLIGEDKKSVRNRQLKLIAKVRAEFHHAHTWTRDRDRLDEARATLQKQIDEYLLGREAAPERTSRLSLTKTKADYTEKIGQLEAEMNALELQREEADQALKDLHVILGRSDPPNEVYTPYLDIAYLTAWNAQLLDRLRELEAARSESRELAGMYIGQVQLMMMYLHEHLSAQRAAGRVNQSFEVLNTALKARLTGMEAAYASAGTLDAVLKHRIDGAAVLAYLDREPPRDERPADE